MATCVEVSGPRLYSLECQSSSIVMRNVSAKYTIHDSRHSSAVTFKQEFPEDNERLFQYISDLDYKEGGVAPVKIGGMADGSSEEDSDVEDEREPSQPFAFKIHYADSSVPSVWIHHASACSGVVERLVCLQQLTELHLSECPLTKDSVYRIQFGPAYNLKVLRLERLCLRRLHPSVGRLRSLQELSLCYNRLTDLPLTIRLLRNLRRLDITGNPFSRLPGAVYHLKLESIIGLNDCPLKKDVPSGWCSSRNSEISWRKPLTIIPGNDYWGNPIPAKEGTDEVVSLQESCVKAAVGMDCWQLQLQERYTQMLTDQAETQGLCQNCLKSVRKLTIQHESLGYTIHAQVAVFCNIRDVPFSFMACSSDCLWATVSTLARLNGSNKAAQNFSKLPSCDYKLEFVQDLEEFRRIRAQSVLPNTFKYAQGRNKTVSQPAERSKCTLS